MLSCGFDAFVIVVGLGFGRLLDIRIRDEDIIDGDMAARGNR